jgi:hypothetical protein
MIFELHLSIPVGINPMEMNEASGNVKLWQVYLSEKKCISLDINGTLSEQVSQD